jgi:GTPase SAR1 family protein
MIDAVKDYLVPKRFGIVGYVCVIVHFLCGLVFTAVAAALRDSENGKFSCFVDAKSTATYKKQVDQACLARYDQSYSPNLPLYGFVLVSIGLPVLVSVIYSLTVRDRVDEIESRHERQAVVNHEQDRKTVYVFYFYFFHLVVRALFGIILTVLQHKYFYSNGFDFKFSCNYNTTLVKCENATASRKRLLGKIVSIINGIVAFVILVEVIYLSWRRLPFLNSRSGVGWSCDTDFARAHFLRKRYAPLELQLTPNEYIYLYKQQILSRPRFDFYIKLVIHTERALHKFSKDMKRHEIFDVYMRVPSESISLEKIKDLFYPNKDTQGNFPRSILVIGRPGIGKTVLTEKILRDWAEATNQINEQYCDKIAFSFKLRWFNNSKLENISLKTFLQFGTGLSDEKFESIYEEITKKPQKAILIFDGLDEFHGNPINCLDQSRMIPNDPNACMSAINLFVKLVLGDLLKGATVLVTSRPTADDFYSRFDFDRKVEITGFTYDKIEEYVSRFCSKNNKTDLELKIWEHIKSSSELLNLCYIPVNCFIICVTLSGCLSEPKNDTNALPTTLTELYQNALRYYEKYDNNRDTEGNPMATEKALKKLQLLAFRGMENGQLIFDQEFVDEQMKKSCLLNSLSNPIFPIQTQFCFIHLTIQEFLAARHVTETLDKPVDIKKFISDHVGSGRWHLVLQFIAGFLGKKIKMFEYKDCVSAFADTLEVTHGEIKLNHNHVFAMTCLMEVDNGKIVEEVCETTALNDVVMLDCANYRASPSQMAVVSFVCKHMKNLASLKFNMTNAGSGQEVLELLQKRCIKQLELNELNERVSWERVLSAFIKLNCTLNHEHTKLTSLKLRRFSITTEELSNVCMFFENGHASHLEILDLQYIGGLFWISKLCEALNKNDNCTKLTCLRLPHAMLKYEDASVLFDTLTKGLRKLAKLDVCGCMLRDLCIPTLVKALQDERCQLTDLSLRDNAIGDKGAGMLFEDALTKEHCKLTELNLSECSLTDRCIPSLCKALQDERCQLTVLSLGFDAIGDKGARMLFEDALTKEHCKLTKLDLSKCSLTDRCIPSLCKALQDEHCQLTVLLLRENAIGDKCARMLFEDALTKEHCKLTELNLGMCSLTDRCIPSLCKALQDKHCQLTVLLLWENAIGDKGAGMLFEDALTKEHCKLTELNLARCSLTDRCIPSLCKALQDERCKLTELRLYANQFTGKGKTLLDDVQKYPSCKSRGLLLMTDI